MIINGYVENINVKYSEMDYNKALKPFSLLNYLQDIASKNAEDLGFGYSFITPKNIAWFLLKYHMEFNNYPVDVKNLTLKTQRADITNFLHTEILNFLKAADCSVVQQVYGRL